MFRFISVLIILGLVQSPTPDISTDTTNATEKQSSSITVESAAGKEEACSSHTDIKSNNLSASSSHDISDDTPAAVQEVPAEELGSVPAYNESKSLYNLTAVTAELPDEIMEDEDPIASENYLPHDISAHESPQGEPVSVICAPKPNAAADETLPVTELQRNDTVIESNSTKDVNTVSQLCDQDIPSNHIDTTSKDNDAQVEAQLQKCDSHSAEDAGLVIKETGELCYQPGGVKVTKASHHLHLLGDHEPAENGSSTSTDSGVNTGSPKSDMCPTPPYG